jgi:hypothetical protein
MMVKKGRGRGRRKEGGILSRSGAWWWSRS